MHRVKLKDGRYGWLEKHVDNEWYIVQFADGWGWVRTSDLEVLNNDDLSDCE